MVIVTAGNNRGTVGEVLEVITDSDRVIVKGVNIRTKNLRRSQTRPQGGQVKQEMRGSCANLLHGSVSPCSVAEII
jgi:ribosomal protein L24